MRGRRRILMLVPLLLLGGCPGLESITGRGARVDLEFDAQPVRTGQYLPDPVITVEGTTRAVVVEALLSTPDPCRAFVAEARSDGETIVLAVRVHSNSEGCIAVVGNFEYTAVLSGLERGTYRLVITHAFAGTGDPTARAVFDGEVVVQ